MIGTQTTVTTTATLIVDEDSTNREVIIHAVGNGIVYLGGSDVTTSTGFYLDKDAGPLRVQLLPKEKIYGIVSVNTELVTALLPNA